MRAQVDKTKCCGYGNCFLVAPALFDIDDADNLARPLLGELTDSQVELATVAADECPADAITLTG